MAKKPKKTPKWQKKNRKRLEGNGRSTIVMYNSGNNIVPDEMYVKLKYVNTGNLNQINGAFKICEEYFGNDINQVVLSTAGTQPMGHDQWARFYGKFQVMSSNVNVEVVQLEQSTVNAGCNVCLSVHNAILTPVGIRQQIEQPYSKNRLMMDTGQGNKAKFNIYMNTKKILGYHNDIKDLEDTHGSLVPAASPKKFYIYSLTAAGVAGSAYNLTWQSEITYYVRLFDRLQLNTS